MSAKVGGMRKLLFVSALTVCSAPAWAATAQCDAKAFTLAKPAVAPGTSKQAQAAPVAAPANPPRPAATPKGQPKPRLLATCKDKKKSG
jgi:hypothetical protein